MVLKPRASPKLGETQISFLILLTAAALLSTLNFDAIALEVLSRIRFVEIVIFYFYYIKRNRIPYITIFLLYAAADTLDGVPPGSSFIAFQLSIAALSTLVKMYERSLGAHTARSGRSSMANYIVSFAAFVFTFLLARVYIASSFLDFSVDFPLLDYTLRGTFFSCVFAYGFAALIEKHLSPLHL